MDLGLQEKLELSRGLGQQTRLNADLAQENEALAARLNEQGKAMDALQKKVSTGHQPGDIATFKS